MILKIDLKNPQKEIIQKAVQSLKNGNVIVYPTDTLYGLGCDIFNKNAVKKIYKIKKRHHNKPLSFICEDFNSINKYAIMQNYAYKLMKKLLPGPYTFILKASKIVPKSILPKRKTVGIRVPNNNVALQIVKQLKNPIITTSVNLSNQEPFSDPEEIEKFFNSQINLILDAGIIQNKPSNVIDLTGQEPVILRGTL